MDGEAGDNAVAAAVPNGSSGSENETEGRTDHDSSDSAPSIPPGMESRSIASTDAVEDRTAAEMFADLKAAAGTVDADAVLDETNPNELIDRANDPPMETEASTDLFDEAAFEANIIPDREPDGEFLWIDPGESMPAHSESRTDPTGDAANDSVDDGATSESTTESDEASWTGLSGQPSADRLENDHVESTVASLSTTVAATASGDGSTGADADGSIGAGDRPAETSANWLEANEPDVSGVRTESTSAATRSKQASDTTDSTASLPRSVVTDEFDSVSAPGSGRVPTRSDPPERDGVSTSSGVHSSTRDRRRGSRSRSDGSPDPTGGTSAADSTESNAPDEPDASEVRTTVVSFDRHRQQEPDSTGRMAGLRQLLGRFRNSNDLG